MFAGDGEVHFNLSLGDNLSDPHGVRSILLIRKENSIRPAYAGGVLTH